MVEEDILAMEADGDIDGIIHEGVAFTLVA
jgi:hypothetical protein